MTLAANHAKLKATRQRGATTPNHLASIGLLRRLEDELHKIRAELNVAWGELDSRDFRKCSRHMDAAQQRMHRVIRRLARRKK